MHRLVIVPIATLSFCILMMVTILAANRSPLPTQHRVDILANCTSRMCMNVVLGQTQVGEFPALMDKFFDPINDFEVGHLSSGREVWIAALGSTSNSSDETLSYISAQTTTTSSSEITSMAFGLSGDKVEDYPTLKDLLLRFNCAPIKVITNGNRTLLLRCNDVYMLAYLTARSTRTKTIPIFAVTVYDLNNAAAIQGGIECKWHGFFALNRCLL